MGARPHGDLKRVGEYVGAGEIKIGDFVVLNSAGKVAVAAASSTAGLLGAAVSYCKQDGDKVLVGDSPDQEWLVKKSSTAPSSQTDYNLNYDIVATTSSNKDSNHKLDSSTGATTPATLPLRAVSASRLRVAPALTDGECVVRINQHAYRNGTAGV